MFSAPLNARTFIDQITERTKTLIRTGLWSGLSTQQVDIWMKNFEPGDEKYFAACILDAFIYRSEDQTTALMNQLLDRTLVDLARRNPEYSPIEGSWREALCNRNSNVTMIPVTKNSDGPTKSAPVIARNYCRNLSLDKARIKTWEQFSSVKHKKDELILFVDDFLGTGHQFETFANANGLNSLSDGISAVYAPLVAHRDGIRHIQEAFPTLQVVAVETLGSSHQVFSDDAVCFKDGLNSPAKAKEFYLQLVKRKAFPPNYYLGYGDLAVCIAFHHSTPNNSLPILWRKSKDWNPLIER